MQCKSLVPLLTALCLSGCGGMQKTESSVYREDLQTPSGQPAYITVQHCLIGFDGSVPGKSIFRTREEAEQLAQELFAKAQAGEDFGGIVSRYTDDSPPGIYRMANNGFPGEESERLPSNRIYERGDMVPAFGDTGFPLEVGQIGLAPHDPQASPFGWHIIKRIK